MSQKKRRSPQEKKQLSYRKDRRDTYGENDKAARKSIPLRKKLRNRAERKAGKHLMETDAEMAQSQLDQKHRRAWKKTPDEALGKVLVKRLSARDERIDGKRNRRLANQKLWKWLEGTDV